MPDKKTWGKPDKEDETTWTTHQGKKYTVKLKAWLDIRMRGKKEYPMHKYPFTLIRVNVFNEKGLLVFKRPMWLIVIGKRRLEVSLVETWQAYRQRVDLEHYFRFGKQKLLFNRHYRDLNRRKGFA